MKKWTKKGAIERMHNNALLQQVLQTEPRIKPILEEAEQQKRGGDYHRIRKYIELKRNAYCLVGWSAENKELRTREFYAAVISTIGDLLPPDDVDLIHSGIYLIKSDNLYKIGKSSNCEERIKAINAGLPQVSQRIHVIYTDEENEVERYWHQRFYEKRRKGEWFDLSEDEVLEFMSVSDKGKR